MANSWLTEEWLILKPYVVSLTLAALFILLLTTGCASQQDGPGQAGIIPQTMSPSAGVDSMTLVATDGNASLYKIGNISVIRVEGSYREMGRQYGRLVGTCIAKMYETIVASIGEPGFIIGLESEEQLVNFSMRQYSLYPQEYREIVEGMAESSGIPVAHIAVIDQVVPTFALYPQTELTPDRVQAILAGKVDPTPGNTSAIPDGHHCSSIIAWGDYTGGGPLVMGRNFDFGQAYRHFNPYRSVIVYNPTDGSVPTAVLGWSGTVGGIEMFNRAGLVMETDDNHVVTAPNNEVHIDRIPLTVLVLRLGMDSATIEQFDAAMKTARFGYPLLSNVATEEEGYTYEIGTRDVVRRGDDRYGLQVIANFPLAPYWDEPSDMTDLDTGLSISRRNNLIALAEKYKGAINATVMEAILDTRYADGGASFDTAPEGGSVTIYQFVYIPRTRMLYLKAPTYDDWTAVPLAPLFKNP